MTLEPRIRRAAIVAASLALWACDGSDASAPGAVSKGEAEALEEAAEMLDEQRLPDGALPDLEAPIVEEAPKTQTTTEAAE